MSEYSHRNLNSPATSRSFEGSSPDTTSDPGWDLQPLGNAEAARALADVAGQEASGPGPAAGAGNQGRLEALGDCGYEVQEGDTLWGIAEAHTGDGQGWKELYADNQDVVGDNPDLILPGQVLDVCGDTLETGEGDNQLTEAAEEQAPASFVDVATGMFPTLAGEDGFLSSDDLDAAMTNPNLTLEQSAALVTLRRLQSELEKLGDDEWFDENSGITLADLEQYRQTGQLPGSKYTPDEWYAHDRKRMQGLSRVPFANKLPDVGAIRQGRIGDCYFLAALGSAVSQDPKAVAEMVVQEDDGPYTVTFPNGQSANVAAPTLAEMATYGSSGADGMWVTLFERAAAKSGVRTRSCRPRSSTEDPSPGARAPTSSAAMAARTATCSV